MVLQCMLDNATDRRLGWANKNDSKGEEEGFQRVEGKPQAALPKWQPLNKRSTPKNTCSAQVNCIYNIVHDITNPMCNYLS